MNYSQLFIKRDIKIPNIVSFLIIALTIFGLGKFLLRPSIPSQAEKKVVKRLEITNILSNQVSIFWQSEQKETGWIVYGERNNNLDQTAFDERDFDVNKDEYSTHYVTLRNLHESTPYYFKLVSGNVLIGNQNGASFTFTTLNQGAQITNFEPAYGKIVNKNGAPLENAIVILSIPNSIPLSTLSKQTGEWLIPLNSVLDKSSLNLKSLTVQDQAKIEILTEDSGTSSILTKLDDLSPLPQTIVIGKNYNFKKKESVLSAATSNKIFPIEILFPKEKAVIPAESPLIKGTAVPGEDVGLEINQSKNIYSSKTKTDKDGLWRISLTRKLAPGNYVLVLKTEDQKGAAIKKIRRFTIAKSGEKVLGEATPEATVTSTPTLTAVPTEITSLTTLTPTTPVTGGENISFFALISLTFILIGLGLLIVF